MRTILQRLGFLVLLCAGVSSEDSRPAVPGLRRPADGLVALVGGSVIDGTGAEPLANCTVLIDGERIVAVGPKVEVPPGAEVVDVSGLTIMPGLIDMHGHLYANLGGQLSSQLRPYSRLYLAGGVTTVFSPGDFDPEATLAFRDAQRQGEEIGTRIYSAGPYFTHATPQSGWMNGVVNAQAARTKLRAWGERIDGVKVYTGITQEEFSAVVDEADKLGLRVTGHLGSLTAGQAIDLGIDRLEHGIFAMSEFGRPDPAQPFDVDYLRGLASIDFESGSGAELIEKIIANEIVIDPTIVIMEAVFDGPLELAGDWQRYLTPQANQRQAGMRQAMADMRKAAAKQAGGAAGAVDLGKLIDSVLDKQRELVLRVHQGGGLVVCGTDPVFAEILPGYGMHREAEHFVLAGLTELEAIRACTLSAARALGLEDDIGTIAPGKLADLIVIDGDPAADITDLAHTQMVYQAGTLFSPQELRDSVVETIE